VDQAVTHADDDITDLLEALADVSPDDATLAYLGAGPIEDLIYRHGARFVDRIDQAAVENPRF
jgi:hypothetical protein